MIGEHVNINSPNLVSLYRFENNLNDSKGSNNLSASVGTPIYDHQKFNHSVKINSSNGGRISKSIQIVPYNGPATVALWYKPDLTASSTYIFSVESYYKAIFNYFSRGVWACGNSDHSIEFGDAHDPEDRITTLPITDAIWHYMVFAWSGLNMKIYVDGVLMASGAITDYDSALESGSDITSIGSTRYYKNSYYQQFDEVSFYNAYDCLSIPNQKKWMAWGTGRLM